MGGFVHIITKETRPAESAAAVTPSDTDSLDPPARALYVGGGGDVRIMTNSSTVVTLSSVAGGSILPIKTLRVFSSATTATSIVALW